MKMPSPASTRVGRTLMGGSGPGSATDWATPPEVFDPLQREFGFTLDVCASRRNAKLPWVAGGEHEVRYWKGRIRFLGRHGEAWSAPFASALAIYRGHSS